MKAIGFDGKEYKIKLSRKKRKNCSKLHLRARNLLTNLFPTDIIYEEVALPGSRTISNQLLYADFFIPSQRLIVEAHGKQHYTFSIHFHKNRLAFARHIQRDNKKREWCFLNQICLVILSYMENDDEWTKSINNREWMDSI